MAKNSNQGYKEKKKPKKNKGSKLPGRKYPGSFPIMPDFPGTGTVSNY